MAGIVRAYGDKPSGTRTGVSKLASPAGYAAGKNYVIRDHLFYKRVQQGERGLPCLQDLFAGRSSHQWLQVVQREVAVLDAKSCPGTFGSLSVASVQVDMVFLLLKDVKYLNNSSCQLVRCYAAPSSCRNLVWHKRSPVFSGLQAHPYMASPLR